jgi:phage-related protein
MAKSINYNGTDLSAYGLRLKNYDDVLEQLTESAQVRDKAVPLGSVRPARVITMEVAVYASSLANRLSYLDSIKSVLNLQTPAALKLDSVTDRYWLALGNIYVRPAAPNVLKGEIVFTCHDPDAYDNTETDSDKVVDTDPDSITETAGGTANALPVITITIDDTFTDTELVLENLATGEEFTWEGSLVASDVLVIDCAAGHVTLNGADSMLTVSGDFLTLLAGSNAISTSGFTGDVNFTYRKRYL